VTLRAHSHSVVQQLSKGATLRVGPELAVIELRDIGVAPSSIRRSVTAAVRATGRPVTFVRKKRNRRSEIPHHFALLPYVLAFRYSALPQERSPGIGARPQARVG
jgi:hypothetical protein